MRLATHRTKRGSLSYYFNCGYYARYGKHMCSSHYISVKVLEKLILGDIREMAQRIVLDEKAIREEFIRHNAELADKAVKSVKKELQSKKRRLEDLSRMVKVVYEDSPEDICIGLIQEYSDKQKTLTSEITDLETKLTETENTKQSADDFIRNIKKYLGAPELTREMYYEFLTER